jgi:hypothetical protein
MIVYIHGNGVEEMSLPKIDILIPVIEKDLATLPFVIQGVKKYVRHPIAKSSLLLPEVKESLHFAIKGNVNSLMKILSYRFGKIRLSIVQKDGQAGFYNNY